MAESFNPTIPDENRGGQVEAVAIVFTVFIVLTAVVRLIARSASGLSLSLDDYLICLTTAINIVANAFDIKAVASGLGRHTQYLSPDQQQESLKFIQLAVGLATLSYWAAKMSICFFMLQLIRGTDHRTFRRAVYALMGLITVSSFLTCLFWGLQARPFARLWDPTIPGTTVPPSQFIGCLYFNYATNMLINIFYSLSPVYFLNGVQMNKQKKWTVYVLIGSGLLLVVVSALNIAFIHDFWNREDGTYAFVDEFICDIVERNFTVVIANLPGLWLLTSHLRGKYSTHKTTTTAVDEHGKLVLAHRNKSQPSIGANGQSLPLTPIAQRSLGRINNPWKHVGQNGSEEEILERDVHASGYPDFAGDDSGIHVQTDIVVREERQAVQPA